MANCAASSRRRVNEAVPTGTYVSLPGLQNTKIGILLSAPQTLVFCNQSTTISRRSLLSRPQKAGFLPHLGGRGGGLSAPWRETSQMKPSTPETARRRRSPARRRPSEAAGALDFGAVDQPSAKTESDRKGMLSRVAIAVLSIATAVAAAYFCADVMGTEVSIVNEEPFVPAIETASPSPAMIVTYGPAWAANAQLRLVAADAAAADFELEQVLHAALCNDYGAGRSRFRLA